MIIDMARVKRRAPTRPGESEIMSPAVADDDTDAGNAAPGRDRFEAKPVPRESLVRGRLIRFLEKQTGKRFDETLNG